MRKYGGTWPLTVVGIATLYYNFEYGGSVDCTNVKV